jgi:hypothetical protein
MSQNRSSDCEVGVYVHRLECVRVTVLNSLWEELPQNKLCKFVPGDLYSVTNEMCLLLVFGINISLTYHAVLIRLSSRPSFSVLKFSRGNLLMLLRGIL